MLIICALFNNIKAKLGANVVAMQMQVGMSEDFESIIDLLTRKMAIFKGEKGETVEWVDVPQEYHDKMEELAFKNGSCSM